MFTPKPLVMCHPFQLIPVAPCFVALTKPVAGTPSGYVHHTSCPTLQRLRSESSE